jgi:2,4-dienoyl-CoA reductase-like NADH-dependent reductase (Old Yellow Enzyme family)
MSAGLPQLFSPLEIRGHRFKNRIFSTGHMTVMLEDGFPSAQMVAYHAARAAGGAGLIIIEAARAHRSGISARPSIKAYDDGCIEGYRGIADACHPHDCRVFGQLAHPGREMSEAPDGSFALAHAPSALPNERFHVMPREMPLAMIAEIVTSFGTAAARLQRAGLDGIEVIASHGYLLAQFLNPRANQRSDRYGGDFNGRLAFVCEVLAAVRQAVGEEMIVGMRISGDEMQHDGLNPDDVLEIAAALAGAGLVDYLNVTAGSSTGLGGSVHIVPPMAVETAYVAPFAAAIRARVSVPIFVAGRINQPQIAEQVLANGQADMCGMTRAMITDPQMPNKAAAGRLDDIRACIACNQACIGHMLRGFPISCIQYPESGRELEFGALPIIPAQRRILVAGGGPGGMKAAAIAAARGHDVTLYEAEEQLGGQANLAQLLPGRAEFGGIIANLRRELDLAGASIVTGTKVDRALIEKMQPDAVIIATGATPYRPVVEGADEAHILDAWQVLKGEANIGADVVIADWRCDWIGMGLAEMLTRAGSRVRLAVNGITAGEMIPQYARDKWLGDLHRLGIEIIPYARLFGADGDTVYLQHTTSGEPIICEGADTLVTAHGHQSVTNLEAELQDWPGEVHVIGDCLAPRTAEEAVLEGLRAGVIV